MPLIPLPSLLDEDLDFVLNETRELWDAFRGQVVFITGGTGFFGTWLLETFLAANRRQGLDLRLMVTSRDPAAFLGKLPHLASAPEIHWIKGGLADLDLSAIERQLGKPLRCRFVIHLITEGDPQSLAADPLRGIDVIVESTRRALEIARAAGAKRFLFTSSGAVYGRQPPTIPAFEENYPGAPDPTDVNSVYGAGGNSKRHAETLCAAYSKEGHFDAVIARCFTFFGPHLPLDGKFAIGNFLRDALAHKELVIRGDGTPIRSYLYAADLTVWLLHLLVRGQPGRAFNVGSEKSISIRELAQQVALASGESLPVRIEGVASASAAADRYLPSTQRIATELGLREQISLNDGLARTLRWLRSSTG